MKKPVKKKPVKKKPVKKKPTFRKSPPKRGKWKKYKFIPGTEAADIIDAADDWMAENAYDMIALMKRRRWPIKHFKTFVKYIKDIGFTERDAYIFWFSPP